MGVDARPLFRMPIFAKSLAEFWSLRWNQGFTEMTALAVYRPLVKRLGRPAPLSACFLVSGLFHELAISVPVNAGYGLPMTYFVLHGLLVVGEEKWRTNGYVGKEISMGRRLWTAAWLLIPLPLVFHSPFYRGLFVPWSAWVLIKFESRSFNSK